MSDITTVEGMREALLPCPFCGSQPHTWEPNAPPIFCTACGVSPVTVDGLSFDQAAAAWNRRAPATSAEQMRAAIRAIVTEPHTKTPGMHFMRDREQILAAIDALPPAPLTLADAARVLLEGLAYDNALNDAGWEMTHAYVRHCGEGYSGRFFNSAKGIFHDALSVYLHAIARGDK